MSGEFQLKNKGEVGYCIGVEFHLNDDSIKIHQRSYILDTLSHFGMSDSNPTATPMEAGVKLTTPTGNIDEETAKLPYRELIGTLMYLATATRPDIAHAVSCLSQFLTKYSREHWNAAKRVLRYLKGTINIGITYKARGDSLQGFTDADWGNCPMDRRSYTGYVFTYNGGAVSWESRKQRTVALSSTEAEYMALTEASKEAIHLRKLLTCINHEDSTDIVLYSDNQGALRLADNPVFHSRSKHIDIRHHFVRQVVNKKLVRLEHISTDDMAADMLTKGLPRPKHLKCMFLVGQRSEKSATEHRSRLEGKC